MSEIFATVWGQEELLWLALIIFVAGTVRGFAGFGTGLIYIPLASNFMPPISVLITVMVVDLVGTIPLMPRALKDGSKSEISALLLGCMITLPFGVVFLTALDPLLFRWLVSLLSLGVIALLVSGIRHHVTLGPKSLIGVGGLSGFLGGISGMPGPPIILAYMSGQYGPARIRANTMMFLLGFEFMLAVTFALRGMITVQPFVIGVFLIVPYALGNIFGARIFNPDKAKLYRVVAYVIIGCSALIGLPLFD